MASIEYKSGSDCTGSNGSLNRTLTLSNTSITDSNNFLLYLNGFVLEKDTQYTIEHNTSNSVITFLVPVWDDQPILAYYATTTSRASSLDSDFIKRAISRFGESVTLQINGSESISKWGDSNYTTSNQTITVVHNDIQGDEEFNKDGKFRPGDKVFFGKFDVSRIENKLGSDCTGSSGDTNRVLTLGNTNLVKDDLTVYLNGLILEKDTQYTLNNKIVGATITFLSAVWDDQQILVNYTTTVNSGSEIIFENQNYEIKDVITHHIQGNNFVHEIRCSKV